MKYFFILCLVLFFSCNKKEKDKPEEDYDTLFPLGEIEKPENMRGDLIVKLCDPELALENYKYPGEEISDAENRYEVTLSYVFTELDERGNFVDNMTARYTVTYINEKKELITITSDGEEGSKNGFEYKIVFYVNSGFPMYLCVNGVGPRNSNVKARITAVSTDGLIEIPALETEQYQNNEGPNKLKYPYCEYIVLP